jgi:transposase-like protein
MAHIAFESLPGRGPGPHAPLGSGTQCLLHPVSVVPDAVQVGAMIDGAARRFLACPRCRQTKLRRDGKANNLQRYRCISCRRSFNSLTGTPLARLRLKARWLTYCDCLRDAACTVHSAALQTGVHRNTSFRWRHRFLAWVKHDRPHPLRGLVAVDEARLPESDKGKRRPALHLVRHGTTGQKTRARKRSVQIIIARDQAGRTLDMVVSRSLSTSRGGPAHMLAKLGNDVVLVGDACAQQLCCAAQRQATSPGADAARSDNDQVKAAMLDVKAYTARFRQWLGHFKGVATAYLRNYLGWRWAIDGDRIGSSPEFLRSAIGYTLTHPDLTGKGQKKATDTGGLHEVPPDQRRVSAATSSERNLGASLSSTPLTYLCPSMPPKDLVSSTASLMTTR